MSPHPSMPLGVLDLLWDSVSQTDNRPAKHSLEKPGHFCRSETLLHPWDLRFFSPFSELDSIKHVSPPSGSLLEGWCGADRGGAESAVEGLGPRRPD